MEYPEEKIGKLFVDSEKIAWVLTNLLSNAIRYSKENGRVVIGAKQEDNIIELYVQDLVKGLILVITKVSLTVISVYPERKCKVAGWGCLFREILWKLMAVR